MMEKFSKGKKIVFCLLVITIFFFSSYYINKQSIKPTEQSSEMISDTPQDVLDLGKGYSLGVDIPMNSNANQSIDNVNGRILMDTPQDILEVSFSNNLRDEQFILKIFYDYEEIKFKPLDENKFDSSYIFELETGNTITLPFELNGDILKDNKSHKLTVGIYASPNEHTKIQKLMTNFFGMTLDYEIFYEDNGTISLKNQDSTISKTLDDVSFEGLVINNNIGNVDEVLFPPYSIKVKKEERIELAYFANLTQSIPEEVENYLILSMLDWKQIKMNGHSYLLLDKNSINPEYGTYYITAPDKAGLYEFVAFIIPNPENRKNEDNYFPIETAYKFTIEVVD